MIYGMDRLSGTHPYLWAAMGYLGYKSRYDWKVISGKRAPDEQLALWQKGRDESGNIVDPLAVVTDTKTSAHIEGLAIDVAPTVDGGKTVIFDDKHPAYDEKAALLKALPFVQTDIVISSGPDREHIQVRNWQTMRNWRTQWAGFAIALGAVTLFVALKR